MLQSRDNDRLVADQTMGILLNKRHNFLQELVTV